MRTALERVGNPVTFGTGEILRRKGDFASDLLLITDGEVTCSFSDSDDVDLSVGPGAIVGEIGFLTGHPATATLRAAVPVRALSLDPAALGRLQRDNPRDAADVLRHLAQLMKVRTEENAERPANVETGVGEGKGTGSGIRIIRCSTLDQLRVAQRLRYAIQCLENGHASADADDADGTIIDDLDRSGATFVASQGGQPAGTARVNIGDDASTRQLARLFRIRDLGIPAATCAWVTRSAIRSGHLGGALHGRLLADLCGFSRKAGATDLMLDCDPMLIGFFVTFGFSRTSEELIPSESGPSVPMRLALGSFDGSGQ